MRDTYTIDLDPGGEEDDQGYPPLSDDPGRGAEEDDAAYQALVDEGVSPGEAQETVDHSLQLSEEEADALDEYPLEDLTRVDDAEHDRWLSERVSQGGRALDRVLEDASYGEGPMRDEERDEERLEKQGLDHSGWGFRSAFRKLGHGLRKGITAPVSLAKSSLRFARKFVPGRDAGKAKLVRNTYRKLWYEHANWLAVQDKAAGVPLKTRAEYEYVAKLWAKNELAKENIPTSYAVDSAGDLGAYIMGADVMGSWWNPFSWFSSKVNVVVNNTAGQRADQPPDEQAAQATSPGDMSTDVTDATPGASQVTPSATEGEAMGWNGARRSIGQLNVVGHHPADPLARALAQRDENDEEKIARHESLSPQELAYARHRHLRGVHGDANGDSLGAFAAQILGRSLPAQDNPSAERVVRDITTKLGNRQEISPGELGLLSTAAREGNVTARKVLGVLQRRGAVVSGDSTGLDPWMYKLNPSYWFASSQKKGFIDQEKKNWKANAEEREKLAKRQVVLDAAERAETAKQEVEKSRQQAVDTEARLKAIKESLQAGVAGTLVGHSHGQKPEGMTNKEWYQLLKSPEYRKEHHYRSAGTLVGHEKPTAISDVVLAALEREGKRDVAGRLYAKVRSGHPLTKDELRQAQQVTQAIGRVRVVHGDLIPEEEVAELHGAFVGACALGAVDAALERSREHLRAADLLSQRVASGSSLTPDERVALARVERGQQELRRVTTSLTSGAAFANCPPRERRTLSRGAFVGAAQVLGPEDKQMLAAIVKLAKVGNPRARKALDEIRKSGVVASGDSRGPGIKDFFNYATAPVWLPAKSGSEVGLFWSKKKKSAEQVRLAQMKAANKRLKAAQARAAAADAQNEADQRAQEAIAAAADAEADAADAEAAVKEQAMKTKEAEAAPDITRQSQSQDAQQSQSQDVQQEASGAEFVGAWTNFIGKGTRDAKLVARAAEESPTGTKIRAGARVYKHARKGDPKARRAVRVMAAKSRRGEPQATRDLTAVRAGALALRAKKRAEKRQLRAKVRAARRAQVIAAQRKFEARAAERLARMSRRRELRKMAKVERMASRGHPKARAYVAKKVAAAKAGDKKARAQVQAMRLGRVVRTSVKTRQERRNMRSAEKMARRLRAGDPRAIRQYRILQAAEARGNPNARRALQRLALAGAVLGTVATGVVMLPKVAGKKKHRKLAPGTPEHARAQRQVADARARARAGVTTREEAVAAARLAHELGDREAAGELSQASSRAPSATEGVKRAAGRVAASQAGDAAARKELNADLEASRKGNPDAINKLGQVAAARTVDAVERGEPVPLPMRDAVNLQERARAGDPAAQETLRNVSEAATSPDPPAEATEAAVYATGAAALASALASKPRARREFMEKVNQPVPRGEQAAAQAELASVVAKVNEGTATPEEGERGVELAMRLHEPKVAAEISAKAPPVYRDSMSTLPDQALPPVVGVRGLVRASLQALTFSTPDPLGNYREALVTRGGAEAVSLGWSPFNSFKKAGPALPMIAMLSPPVAATASVANLFRGSGRKSRPAPAPAPAATPVEAPPDAKPYTATENILAGDDTRDVVRAALASKAMSRADFGKAVNARSASTRVSKSTAADQLLAFLTKHGVRVG